MQQSISLGERKQRIIQEVLGDERLADVLSNILGYKIIKAGGRFKFSLREERTPSTVVNKDGSVHDFGTAETIGFLQLVANKYGIRESDSGKQFLSEIKKAEEILGLSDQGCSYEFTAPKLAEGVSRIAEYITEPLEESYIGYFKQQGQKNMARVMEFCKILMPGSSDHDHERAIRKFEIGYDPKRDRLIFPVRDMKGVCYNLFRYTPHSEKNEKGKENPKILYLSNRERGIFNLSVVESKPKTLFILEGEKDVINATISGMAAITQGSAGSWRTKMAIELREQCSRLAFEPSIIILQDHDEPGLKATMRIYSDLAPLFENVKMVFFKRELSEWVQRRIPDAKVSVVKDPPQNPKKGFDYSDYKAQQRAS